MLHSRPLGIMRAQFMFTTAAPDESPHTHTGLASSSHLCSGLQLLCERPTQPAAARVWGQ